MGVDLDTPILTKRGVLRYTEVTTDDETLARLPDTSLVWTPITGISVVENQKFITVTAPRGSLRCSYEQRVWINRRRQYDLTDQDFVDTLDSKRVAADSLIVSGGYHGGQQGRNIVMSSPDARLLGLLVAGYGVFVDSGDGVRLEFHTKAKALPRWFYEFMLADVEFRDYGTTYVVAPSRSRRMQRMMKKPLTKLIWDMDIERREEFLSAFFGVAYRGVVPEDVQLCCYLCYQTVFNNNGAFRRGSGIVPLRRARYDTETATAWSVTTEAGGWTVKFDNFFMPLST